MSHRTDALPEVSGFLSRQFRELRYHEASRQASGFLFVILVAILGRPSLLLWTMGMPLMALGTALRLWASGHVMKNERLAVDGPYARVRHPLYSGNIIGLTGFAVAGGLWWGWLALAAILWTFYPAAVEYEDRKLRRIFGDDWVTWSRNTPALLPRLGGPVRTNGAWSVRQSMRNGEPLVALFVCALYVALLMRAFQLAGGVT